MQEAIHGGTEGAVLRFGEGFGDGIELGFQSDGEAHGANLVRWCAGVNGGEPLVSQIGCLNQSD